MNRVLCLLLCALIGLSVLGAAAAEEILIPELNTAQRPIPDNEAMEFLKAMGIGWNLGNTFDATKGDWNRNADEMTVESSWCGFYTTEAMIEAISRAGYSTIRIPVSWHDHVDADDHISERWLNRVQQVADWAIARDMYVIVNTHHDVSPSYYYPDAAHYDRSAQYLGSVWRQLAERFRDYDQHLILESMNEPRLADTDYEWNFNAAVPRCRESADCINKLNQLFVDIVRESGGNNADRYLMVPAYDASTQNALNGLYFTLPEDSADNRLIISVHAYTPYSFALQDGGAASFNPSSAQQTSEIITFMNSLYDRFITKGIPVVIGEFGARNKKDNLQDRVSFAAFYTAAASARNIPCVWWDNGAFQGQGELFGILRRSDAVFVYPEIVEAMTRYGGYDKLPAAQ